MSIFVLTIRKKNEKNGNFDEIPFNENKLIKNMYKYRNQTQIIENHISQQISLNLK